MLFPQELNLVELLGQCASRFSEIVGDGPTRDADLAEFVHHIHACQQQVMSQSAARAHPEQFRLLGSTIPSDGP